MAVADEDSRALHWMRKHYGLRRTASRMFCRALLNASTGALAVGLRRSRTHRNGTIQPCGVAIRAPAIMLCHGPILRSKQTQGPIAKTARESDDTRQSVTPLHCGGRVGGCRFEQTAACDGLRPITRPRPSLALDWS